MNPPMAAPDHHHSLRRVASACPPPQDGYDNHSFLYRTASDGSPLYFQSENSLSSSASRLSPDAILSMHQQHRAAERSPPLTKSWSDPHLPFSDAEKPTDQVRGQGAFGLMTQASLQAPSMHAKLPKIEEGMQPTMQEGVAQETDSETGQPPTGELMNEFSRALGENLNRDNDEEQDGHREGGIAAAGGEEEFLAEDQGSPKAPSRRGPRGTSSKYRGVTRHRFELYSHFRIVQRRNVYGPCAAAPEYLLTSADKIFTIQRSSPSPMGAFGLCLSICSLTMKKRESSASVLTCGTAWQVEPHSARIFCMLVLHSYSRYDALPQAHQEVGGAHLGRQEASLPGRL